jgi:hypothetical protein
MLIEKVIDHYIEVGKKHPGNPFVSQTAGDVPVPSPTSDSNLHSNQNRCPHGF